MAGTVSGMWSLARRFSTVRWLVAHVLVLAGASAMVLLGRWQLDVSDAKHFDLQNFGYALQWWAFAGFTVFLWLRAMRDAVRTPPSRPSSGGELLVRGQAGVAPIGPAEMSTRPSDGSEPVRYRGYVMPQSSQIPARSGGDAVHGAYNDYLWQLALADKAAHPAPAGRRASTDAGRSPSGPERETREDPETAQVDGDTGRSRALGPGTQPGAPGTPGEPST